MTISIKRFQLDADRLPCNVRLVLSDAETKAESKVWISAQFELDKQSTDRLPLLVLEAVDQLQKLIDEGRANASALRDAQS